MHAFYGRYHLGLINLNDNRTYGCLNLRKFFFMKFEGLAKQVDRNATHTFGIHFHSQYWNKTVKLRFFKEQHRVTILTIKKHECIVFLFNCPRVKAIVLGGRTMIKRPHLTAASNLAPGSARMPTYSKHHRFWPNNAELLCVFAGCGTLLDSLQHTRILCVEKWINLTAPWRQKIRICRKPPQILHDFIMSTWTTNVFVFFVSKISNLKWSTYQIHLYLNHFLVNI